MIPILYAWTEKNFVTEGLGRLADITSITVTEERNGTYECEFQYPVDGKMFGKIALGSIVYTTHDETGNPQPFQIYRRSAPLNGLVTFYAEHISYRLNKIVVKPFTASSITEAIGKIVPNSMNSNEFTFWTDKSVSSNFTLKTPRTVRSLLGGEQGSLLDAYGKGEFEWDKFNVRLYTNRGRDTKATIRYGKNLTSLNQDIKNSGRYNAIAPYWADSDGNVVTLPEGYIVFESAVIDDQALVNEGGIHLMANGQDLMATAFTVEAAPVDFSSDFEEKPTVEQLRQRATAYMRDNTPWTLTENVKISFVNLWETEEYKAVAPLERCSLCDTVNVYYEKLNITGRAKIIRTVYNPLLERYVEMELGEPKKSIGQVIQQKVVSEIVQQVPTVSTMQSAIDAATKLITGGFGGYVRWTYLSDGTPSELLFLDTPDIETAVNILRINKNGIGFSNDGGNTYRTAWTLDGHFVADYIDTGTLNANLLKAGIIMDAKGKNYWNLQTGEISISYDPGEEGEVTRADLARVEQNAQNWAADAEQNAKDYTDTTLTGYATEEYVTGSISIAKEGIETEFSDTFATKADTVTQQVQYYYQSTSPAQLFGGQWSTTAPTYRDGMYIWTKQRYYKGTGSYTESDPVCITGNTGEDGHTGDDALYLYITSNASTMTAKETPQNVTLTGCVGKGDSVDIDPNGTIYKYAWYMQKDKENEAFYDSGKRIPLTINGNLFENRAQMRFTLVDADFFELVTHDGTAITNASGTAIEVG